MHRFDRFIGDNGYLESYGRDHRVISEISRDRGGYFGKLPHGEKRSDEILHYSRSHSLHLCLYGKRSEIQAQRLGGKLEKVRSSKGSPGLRKVVSVERLQKQVFRKS